MSNLKHKLGVQLPLQIKLLTPLHIGCGQSLSPYADYVLDDKRNVCLLDTDKLGSLMYEQRQIDHYINDVIATQATSKVNVLKQFIQHDLKGNLNDLLTGQVLPGHGIDNPILIDRCITTDGQAYIPGSSIKGAIRSALLHHWLRSGSGDSKKALDDFIKQLAALEQRNDYSDEKVMKETETAFAKLVENVFFENIGPKERMPLSCLLVTDTAPCAFDRLGAWQAERLNLQTAESALYSIKECIDPGTVFTTTLSIHFYNGQTYHPLLEAVNNRSALFDVLYEYAYDHLEQEWMMLGMTNERIQQGPASAYDTFVSNLKASMEASNETVSYLRLGAGKMQLYQTIGNALYKHRGSDDKHPDWLLYLNYLAAFKKINSWVYPATRVFTRQGQVPFGWLELQ
jgi:CRISPR type III-A-associated RAMP protein Csm5